MQLNPSATSTYSSSESHYELLLNPSTTSTRSFGESHWACFLMCYFYQGGNHREHRGHQTTTAPVTFSHSSHARCHLLKQVHEVFLLRLQHLMCKLSKRTVPHSMSGQLLQLRLTACLLPDHPVHHTTCAQGVHPARVDHARLRGMHRQV
jgi:hypothetical protein